MHPHLDRPFDQGMGYIVVAVPQIGQHQPLERPKSLPEGQEISQGLAGVMQIAQTVDDRNVGKPGPFFQCIVPMGPNHQAVQILREHPGGIRNRLSAPQLQVLPEEKDASSAEMVHGHLERHPRPGGGLLKEEPQDSAAQRRPLIGRLRTLCERTRLFDQACDLFRRQAR